MIGTLRKKFVAINMALVGTALFIVFAGVLYSNYSRMQNDSMRDLAHALDKEEGFNLPQIGKFPPGTRGGFTPIFQVTVDHEGTILSGKYQHVEIAPEDLQEIITLVLHEKQSSGNLKVFHLRYLTRIGTDNNIRIAFVDQKNDLTMLSQLAISFGLVWIVAMLAFCFISLFLANLALAPVEKAWKQQKQFVADASHELKTPLTIILANLNILSASPQKTLAEQAKWLENTQAEGKRMKNLIDDLLFLAKSDAGDQKIVYSTLNLSDTLWSMVLPFESVAFEQGITMDTNIQEGLQIVGDEGKIKQLIAILLDNACKYCGKEAKVTISLQTIDNATQLCVQNSGEPLAQEDLSHIFDRFYRTDKARVHKQGGYGLGLSIAQSIVVAHNAKIRVESDAQQGTRFFVKFPHVKA